MKSSKIYDLEDVQEEIKLVHLHKKLEANIVDNIKSTEENDYLMQIGTLNEIKLEPKQSIFSVKNEPEDKIVACKDTVKVQEEDENSDSKKEKSLINVVTSISISMIKKQLKE